MASTNPMVTKCYDRMQYQIPCMGTMQYISHTTVECELNNLVLMLQQGAWAYVEGRSASDQGLLYGSSVPGQTAWWTPPSSTTYDYGPVLSPGGKWPWLNYDLYQFDRVANEWCENTPCYRMNECAGLNVPALVAKYKAIFVNWLKGEQADLFPRNGTQGSTLYEYAVGARQPVITPYVMPVSGGYVSQQVTPPPPPGNVLNQVAPVQTQINPSPGTSVLNPPTGAPNNWVLANGSTSGTPALTNNGAAGVAPLQTDAAGWMKDNMMLVVGAGALLLLLSMRK